MKSSGLLLVALLWGTVVSAQSTVYDYVWIQPRVLGVITADIRIVSTVAETQIRRIEKTKNEDETVRPIKAAIRVVQEYESNGWELFDFEGTGMVWIMRKPKQ